MANKNLLTTQAKTIQVEQVYFSPVAVLPSATDTPFGTMYCFLAKVDSWADDNNPEQPRGDISYLKQVFKNMFATKLIRASDVSPVIKRIDWTTGTTYDYFQDTVDMSEKDANGYPVYNFYVKNKYDQVFKCLWNNNGGASTEEPYFEPGSYGTNGIFNKSVEDGGDGYKWKFMFTVDTGLKTKFMDDTWMPVQVGQNTPNPLQTSAGAGSIDAINITDNGLGYDATLPITVTITGDGTGAAGQAVANSQGFITDVLVTNAGSDYTFATVSITSSQGSGATAIAPTSPIGGHGFDPISELGCDKIMITCEFNGTENGVLPVDLDYHQVGIVTVPQTVSGGFYTPANGEIYRTTTDIVVASGFGTFVEDEYVYQGRSLAEAMADPANNFYAKVVYFNPSTNVLYVINKVGTLVENSPIFGDTSATTRTILSSSISDFVPFSGYISYIENRSRILRSEDGIEQFRFVLGY